MKATKEEKKSLPITTYVAIFDKKEQKEKIIPRDDEHSLILSICISNIKRRKYYHFFYFARTYSEMTH